MARLSIQVVPPIPESLQRLGVQPRSGTEVRLLRHDRKFISVQAPGLNEMDINDLRDVFEKTTQYSTIVTNFTYDIHLLRVDPIHTSVWDRLAEDEDKPKTVDWKSVSRRLFADKQALKAQVMRLKLELIAKTGLPVSDATRIGVFQRTPEVMEAEADQYMPALEYDDDGDDLDNEPY